jgi:large subunit ribosomal protein L9
VSTAAPLRAQAVQSASRQSVTISATAKVVKKAQIVLVQPVAGLGKEGTLASVRVGYFRNYLLPQGMAKLADESILAEIKRKKAAEEAAARKIVDEAKALATALQTIGKFTVKVKVGDEKRIFGSVSAQDVVDAVKQQTTKELDKRTITLPDIKTLGTYDVVCKLHPQVNATFQLVVAKL